MSHPDVMKFHLQDVACTPERLAAIRSGVVSFPFTLYDEGSHPQPFRTQFVMSARRARKLAFVDSQGGRCLRCGSTEELTIDHVVRHERHHPIPNNLQVLCLGCNHAKGSDTTDYRPAALL